MNAKDKAIISKSSSSHRNPSRSDDSTSESDEDILPINVPELLKQNEELKSKIYLLEQQNKELKMLMSNIPGGVCQVEMNDDFTLVNGNKGLYNLYGYSEDELKTAHGNRLTEIIYEKDIEYVKSIILEASKTDNPVFEFEHRIIRKDQSVIWILVRGSFSCYSQKNIFNCVVLDITTRKEMEEAIKISEQRFRIALAQTESTIFEYNIATKVMIHGNRSAGTYGIGQITENVPLILVENKTIHPDTATDFLNMYQKIIDGQPNASCLIKTRIKESGHYEWRKISMTTIYDESGSPVQAIGFLEDIDEQVRREDHLRYQSERDSLTGLYNRGTMIDKIKAKLANHTHRNIALMIIIDIDDFKSVNDTYGHMFGDYVLSESAKRISSLFRKETAIGRIGGDEFMGFICDLPSETKAYSCAERIARTFAMSFSDHCHTAAISCSIGIAIFPQDGHTFEDLYQNSDIALYEAKKRGKNQVVAYTFDMQPQQQWVPRSNKNIDSH